MISAVLAARRWAASWQNSKVVFCTDNRSARAYIQKGTTKNPYLLPWVRELHLWSLMFNFDIEANWIPGTENVMADAISRLHIDVYKKFFMSMLQISNLSCLNNFLYLLPQHMSHKSILSCFY